MGDFNLRKKYSITDKQALCCLTRQDRNWFKEQNFPLIHKIIFGLSRKLLIDELLQNPDAVFDTDAKGRTALHWATARAQLDDMRLLIAYGSNPNLMNTTGGTTVMHAVESRNIGALRLVLEAGADTDPQMPEGLFHSSPLTSASLDGLAEMVKLLLRFGAKVDAANPEGRTALHSAAIKQHVECANLLLEHGADMDCVSSSGRTPLVTAIIYNSHAVLRSFLDKRAGRPLEGTNQLLPIIAEHADSETMSILTSSRTLHLNGDCLPADRAALLCRRDYNDMLGYTFENLVSVCQCNEYTP